MEFKVLILLALFLEFKLTSSKQPCPSNSCLFYTDNTRISRIDLITHHTTALNISHLDKVAAIANDVRKKLLIWSDIYRGVIETYNFTSGIASDVITKNIGRVVGIAVDWESELMYWTDFEREEICVATYDGQKRKTLITGGVVNPHGIVVDPRYGLMFWTDWGSRPRIQRATLSGHNQKTIANLRPLRQKWPHGITIDYSSDRLYWIDSYDNVIMSVNFDGGDVFKHRTFSEVHVFSLDMDGGKLYFSDFSSKSIRSIDKDNGSDSGQQYDINSGNVGVTVYEQSRQPQGMNNCVKAGRSCQFLCLLTTNGSMCVCPDGEVLKDDGKSCRGVDKFLLFTESTFYNVYRIPLDKGSQAITQRLPVSAFSRPKAVDFDPTEERVYWSDLIQGALYRSFLNGSYQQRIVGRLRSPSSLAVDWVGGNLYWADKGAHKIEVSKLDGKYRKTVVFDYLEQLTDIALDLKKGLLYWSSYSLITISNPRIEQIDMSGENRKLVAALLHLSKPTGLVIDANRLYWLDEYHKVLQYVNRDNPQGPVTVHLTRRIDNPVTMTSVGGILYLLDKGLQNSRNGAIMEIDKKTGDIAKKLAWYLEKPEDICAIDRTITKTNVSQACRHNHGCSHLCLLNPTGTKCACPDEMTLRNDGKTCYVKEFLMYADAGGAIYRGIYKLPLDDLSKTPTKLPISNIRRPTALDFDPLHNYVYWTDTYHQSISRAQLDGGKRTDLITSDLKKPEGLAVDLIGRNLYWTDMDRNVIEVSKLDGTNRKVLVNIVDEPKAIILDGKRGCMYWTSWGKIAKVERANMDGTNRITIITFKHHLGVGPASPNGLALDHDTNLLYWIDELLGELQFNNLTKGDDKYDNFFSRNEHLLSPFGLDLSKNDIYWSEQQRNPGIYKVNKWVPNTVQKIVGTSTSPRDVHVYHNATFVPASHPCAINNGRCTHLCLVNPGGYQCACPTIPTPGRPCLTTPVPLPTGTPPTHATTTKRPSTTTLKTATPMSTTTSTPITTTTITTTTTTPRATTTATPRTTTATPMKTTTSAPKTTTTTTSRTTTTTTTTTTATTTRGRAETTTANPTTIPQLPTTEATNLSVTTKLLQTATTAARTHSSSASAQITTTYIPNTSATRFKTTTHRARIRTNTVTPISRSVHSSCHPNPCYNNSQCLETIIGFRCRCHEGYTSKLCDVYFGKDKIVITLEMDLKNWNMSSFKSTLTDVLNHYCLTNDCHFSNKRYRRSSTTVLTFHPSDILVIGEPKIVYGGFEIETVVLQPRLKSQPGPREPILGSLLCNIINDAKSSLLKDYSIVALNGKKDPKCQEIGPIAKSKGNRQGDSSRVLSGSLAGGIVAGVFLVLLALMFLYFYRKRKQRHRLLEEPIINAQNVTFNNPGYLEDSTTLDTPLSSPTYEEVTPDMKDEISQTESHDELFWNDLRGAGNPMYRKMRDSISEPCGTNETQHVMPKGLNYKAEIIEKLELDKGTSDQGGDDEDPDGDAVRYVEIPSPRLYRTVGVRHALSVNSEQQIAPNEPEYATISESIRRSKRALREDVRHRAEEEKENQQADHEYASIPVILRNEWMEPPPPLPPKHNAIRDPVYDNIDTDPDNLGPGDTLPLGRSQMGITKDLPHVPAVEVTYVNQHVCQEIAAEASRNKGTYVNSDVFGQRHIETKNDELYVNGNIADGLITNDERPIYANEDIILRDQQLANEMKCLSEENLALKVKTQEKGNNLMSSQTSTKAVSDPHENKPQTHDDYALQESTNNQNYVLQVQGINSNEESFT